MTDSQPILKKITGVQFSIMSPDEIRNKSAVEVTKHETYDKDIPIVKGLFDLRMGTTDMGKVCNTCGLKHTDCPGHFGHVEMARPIYYYHFIDIVIKVYKCICFRCGKLLISKDNPLLEKIKDKSNKYRWNHINELCSKINRCGQESEDGCGCCQPDRYKLDGMNGIQAIWKDIDMNNQKTEIHIQAEYTKNLFEKISDEDLHLMGFSELWCRPEWLICTVLPLPPPAVRPSVKQGNSQRMDDDLTHKLSEIIKFNNALKQKIQNGNRQEIIDDWTNIVTYHVTTLIDNEVPFINQSTHRSGRPLKALRQRLKGKEGRIRNNLMGKRVDFSARSVITPDPNIDIDQLGVPIKIAVNLTYPEKVNRFNKERLEGMIMNGSKKWPGAKSIIKKNSKKITITDTNKDSLEIEYGDIINRHINDGDYVLFNRQPSLHKMSMMGHRIVIMKGNTFRLNVSVTPPYNADFDGDEMNMHVPQSIQAVSELINIASVNNQIISPRENKPIIEIVQDTLLGIYKLTNHEAIHFEKGKRSHYSENTNVYPLEDKDRNTFTKTVDSSLYTKTQMMNIICDLSTFNGVCPPSDRYTIVQNKKIELWSGKCILSYIIPDNIQLEMPNSAYDNNKNIDTGNLDEKKKRMIKDNNYINIIKIVNGSIQQGTFDKDLFSKTSKGLIHTIYNDLGKLRANHFINDLQKIVSYILLIEGFSVGISDMIADENTNNKITEIIKERKEQIEDIMRDVHLNIFEGIPGQTNNEYFESKVNSILNKTINETGKKALENLDSKNRATYMINSGSKGKVTNIAQMIACLGQQNVDGKRIPYGFVDRTLPHYYKYDDSSEARGFVENSFISGQTPQEFFFHAMGGREGLIDTAVKTSQTGYVQRKLVKSMEDLIVTFDYSVRSSSGEIVQFVYGNDGMDAIYVESQPLIITKASLEEIHQKFHYDEKTNWNELLIESVYAKMKKEDYQIALNDAYLKILNHRQYLISVVFQGNSENNINYPIHFQRLITTICGTNRKKKKCNISPLTILNKNEKLAKSLKINDIFENTKIAEILIDIYLHPKNLIENYYITKEEYKMITDEIKDIFYKSKIAPGEMVGAIAAQSIGEPATQMTLNTFHFAGVSAKSNVTRGIPRLKELLHISSNIKSPSVEIHLKDEYRNDRNKANYVKNNIEYTLIKDVVDSSSIYYDPQNNLYDTVVNEDKEMLSIYKEFIDIDEEIPETYDWILRYTFNKEKMLEKNIVMDDIYYSLMKYDQDNLIFTFSDDNSKNLIGRISMKITKTSGTSDKTGIQDQTDIISIFKNINEDILNNISIRGIKGITDIVCSEKKELVKKDKELVSETNYFLETDGTNLIEALNNDFVDYSKTISNDIIEVYEVFGIEAARNILIKEIVLVAEGHYINQRHIELLVDTMTNRGELVSINRQGIKRGDTGPLAKCSFEDTTDQLIKSSIFSEKDKLKGVSSNIMMGQIIKSGTGLCDILLDEEKLMENMNELSIDDDYEIIDETNIDQLLVDETVNIDDDDENEECAENEFKFSFE